jgi:hypothetical protein
VDTTYQEQEPKLPVPENGQYLVYLDIWESQVTFLEDQNIREVALGENGPDTAARAKVVSQVKLLKSGEPVSSDEIGRINKYAFVKIYFVEEWTKDLQEKLQPKYRGMLKARSRVPSGDDRNPCITPPDAQFRGNENQLYRVEIHTGGRAGKEASFKWSRENGSVVFPIIKVEGTTVIIEDLGRDRSLSLAENDWVEIVDDDYILQVAALQGPGSSTPLYGPVNSLFQVSKIQVDPSSVLVTLKGVSVNKDGLLNIGNIGQNPMKHPLLRRWDQKSGTGKKGDGPKLSRDGTIPIKEDGSWITLEDGVQIQFHPGGKKPEDDPHVSYRTGDYWLIPTRTIIGDVLWPQKNDQLGNPEALPPHGVKHHYALLALISFDTNQEVEVVDLRYMLPPLGKLATILDVGSTAGLNINIFRQAGL